VWAAQLELIDHDPAEWTRQAWIRRLRDAIDHHAERDAQIEALAFRPYLSASDIEATIQLRARK
jgi:hypothetical protein